MRFLDESDSINTTHERAELLVNSVLVYVLGHRHDHTATGGQRFQSIFLHRLMPHAHMRTVQCPRSSNRHPNATQIGPEQALSLPLGTAR